MRKKCSRELRRFLKKLGGGGKDENGMVAGDCSWCDEDKQRRGRGARDRGNSRAKLQGVEGDRAGM